MERGRVGQGGSRGQKRGSGRGGRGGFSGSLTNIPNAKEDDQKSSNRGKSKQVEGILELAPKEVIHSSTSGASSEPQLSSSKAYVDLAEPELCLICAEPVQLYSVAPCNHRTCHVCAVRLRALYKKKECTFCKAASDMLIFSTNGEKDFLSYTPEDIPFKDEMLNIYFENATSQEDMLLLLRFNCPDAHCDYVASSWPDIRSHARSEHNLFFCDLCIKHSRIFAHEHKLYTSAELSRHVRAEHKYCDFCKVNFYSDDELYIHMRDRHEQCFICKRDEDRSLEYQRNYEALEKHFKSEHYLCESKECLEKKFVVFESDLDFKAHQVAEHGAELSNREKRDALRVTANFHFDVSSSSSRGLPAGSSGLTARGKPKREEEPETKRDVLGVSQLASRAHVPGAGGAADHQSRRAQFGATLTSNDGKNKAKGKQGSDEVDQKTKRETEAKVRKHQQYMDQVHSILIHSDSKMQSFRGNIKVYRASEMSAKDLIDSIISLVGNLNQVETVVMGLVDLVEEQDTKQDILKAWNVLHLERTQFPSLVPASLGDSSASSAAKGQLRNAKAISSTGNASQIWLNVERAAASGQGYGGMGSRTATKSTKDHFPSLGSAKVNTTPAIPGSARHSALAHASIRATPWAASNTTRPSHINPSSSTTNNSVHPYSIKVAHDPERSNQTSIRSHPTAFPTLPSNTLTANLAAYKRSLFEAKSKNVSGESTPKRAIWDSTNFGRIDGSDADGGGKVDTEALHQRLQDTQLQDRKKGKQKNVVVTLGTSRRGW